MALWRRRDRSEPTDRPQFLVVRAPSASTINVGSRGTSLSMTMARNKYNPDLAVNNQYLCNTYLYGAVRALGEDLASLTLRVGRDPDKAQDFAKNHPLLSLLGPNGKPNPNTTARQLWQWSVAQFIVTGKLGWEIELDGDRPIAFWPLISNRLTPDPTDGGAAYFKRFAYDVGAGPDKILPVNKVFYHWRPSINDWRVPESVLQSAHLDVSVAVMQDIYDYAFLTNDARPAAVVVHEAFDDDDERDAWRRQFLDTHKGASNAGKLAFAQTSDGGAMPKDALFVQTLGLSQKDAEFIKRYEAKIRAMLTAVGVPRTRLLDASERTFSNADEEMKAYWKNSVRQLAINFAEAVNQYLAPRFGGDVVWWDFSENEYLREPPKFSITDGIAAYQAGIVSKEEVRIEAMGLPEEPEVGELEEPAPPPELNPAPEPDALPAAPTPAALPAAASAPFTADALRVMIAEVLSDAGLLPVAQTPPNPPASLPVASAEISEDPEARRARLWRKFDNSMTTLEARYGRRWQKFFDRQADAVISRLNGKRGRQALRAETPNVDAIFDTTFWTAAAVELGLDMHEDALGQAFAQFSVSVGIDFDLNAPFARSFIEARANQLAGHVTQTSYDGIKKALADGAEAGEAIPDLADRIRHLFAQTYANRAVTVARTEVISGYNGGTREAALQSDGVVESMEWISTLDARCRKAHRSADGQVVKVGDLFEVGGQSLRYPGDPNGSPHNIINCRCTIAPVVAEEEKSFGNVIPFDRAARMAVAVARGDARIEDPHMVLHAKAPRSGEVSPIPAPVDSPTEQPSHRQEPVEIVVRVTDQARSIRKRVEYDDDGNISAIVEEAQ